MIESTSIEYLEKSNVRLQVRVSSNETQKSYKKLLKDTAKTVSIPGFRKGKVPESILEKKFGDAIQSDASKNIIEECLKEFFETTDTKPLSFESPVLETIPHIKAGEPFVFEVVYDVFPKVELSKLSDLSIEEPQVTIDSDAINDELKSLQEQNSVVVDKSDKKVETGDIIQYTLCMLGENGEEIPSSTIENSLHVTEENLDQNNLSSAIIGLESNTETIIEIPSPPTNDTSQNSPGNAEAEEKNEASVPPQLQKAKITITSIHERQLPPIDDELAQDISEDFATLNDLKKDIRTKLNKRLLRQLAKLREDSIISQISQENPIVLPESMVRAESENRWNNIIGRSGLDAKAAQKFQDPDDSTKKTLLESWRPDIERDLRHQLIIQTLIDERKIVASTEDINKKIEEEYPQNEKSIEETKKYLEKMGYMEYIEHEVKQSILIDQLLKDSQVTKGKKMKYLDFLIELNETPL